MQVCLHAQCEHAFGAASRLHEMPNLRFIMTRRTSRKRKYKLSPLVKAVGNLGKKPLVLNPPCNRILLRLLYRTRGFLIYETRGFLMYTTRSFP